MELKARGGVWHVHFYVVGGEGRRRLVRTSTGVKVGPTDKPALQQRQRRIAEEAARKLYEIRQLEASGLRGSARDPVALETAITELIKRKEENSRNPKTLRFEVVRTANIFAFFGTQRDVHTITRADLQQYATWALARRKPGTVNKELRLVRQAAYLYTDTILKRPDLGCLYKPRERFLEPEEYEKLLHACSNFQAAGPRAELSSRRDWLILFAHLRLPQGKLTRLRSEHVDLDARTLLVPTRGNRTRAVELNSTILDVLRRRLADSPPGAPLFPTWTTMGSHVRRICKKTGVAVLSPETLPLVLAAWDAHVDAFHPAQKRDYLIMYVLLGLTYSELYRISPTDIDWEGNQVFVRGTKTVHRERVIPMRPAVREVLARRASQAPMFARWSNDNMRRDLARMCKLAGIPPVTPNDLRRTFATWLARAGVPLIHAARLMGHSGLEMLNRVYARVERGQHMHDAISKLPAGDLDP